MVQTLKIGAPYEKPATLRVFFRKVGALQYISHLDLVRTMTRVVIRSRIPVAYSEGFNPIPRLSFAAPLSVGVESEYEILDLKITNEVDSEEVMIALNRNLSDELRVFAVTMADYKVKDAAYAAYTVTLHIGKKSEELFEKVASVLSEKPLTVLKKTKSGEREVDLSPLVKSVSVAYSADEITVGLELYCDNASFLNPDYLVSVLKERLGILSPEDLSQNYRIVRTGIFLSDGTLFR